MSDPDNDWQQEAEAFAKKNQRRLAAIPARVKPTRDEVFVTLRNMLSVTPRPNSREIDDLFYSLLEILESMPASDPIALQLVPELWQALCLSDDIKMEVLQKAWALMEHWF